ncbi:MAG: metal ABC transporter permease [Candidatus Omnitrophica bacterium]|nr:metal ABC transporter permease [Candidatus Omnitrophota bacterium]
MIDFLLQPWELISYDPVGFFSIFAMGVVISISCGLVGAFLIMRKNALLGDAISHAILPGIAVAFLITGSRGSGWMMAGALVAGLLTTLMIDLICRKTRIKEDSAIGIVFSFFFAVGVILISLFAGNVDLDLDCVLYGEIDFLALAPFMKIAGHEVLPVPVAVASVVLVIVVITIWLLYKELLVSSFDPTFSGTIGISPIVAHYLLVVILSLTVVSAFESVGAILVVAMLIIPGSTAYMFCNRLSRLLLSIVPLSILSAGLGVYIAVLFDCSTGGSMVVAAFLLFVFAWVFAPERGLVSQWRRRRSRGASLEEMNQIGVAETN